MSGHNQIRKDKTCLNCKHVVASIYCSNCGQKNEVSSKTFKNLFFHFIEDITHYEGSFWRTLKTLAFKPGLLTATYLSGKRMSYLAPIRLYLFVSFLTFLSFSLLPKSSAGIVVFKESDKPEIVSVSKFEQKIIDLHKAGKFSSKEKDTLNKYVRESATKTNLFTFNDIKFSSIKELDSIQNNTVDAKKLNQLQYLLATKIFLATRKLKKVKSDDIATKFQSAFVSNFPKVLFIYMPIFALTLWLFHNKKRWLYFDHGIFTLHYFSFILILSLVFYVLESIFYALFPGSKIVETIFSIFGLGLFLWAIFCFYKAHRNLYIETRKISIIKSSILLLINMGLISFILVCYIIYTFINIK